MPLGIDFLELVFTETTLSFKKGPSMDFFSHSCTTSIFGITILRVTCCLVRSKQPLHQSEAEMLFIIGRDKLARKHRDINHILMAISPCALCLLALLLRASEVEAVNFTAGNVLALRVSSGSAALSSAATVILLEELNGSSGSLGPHVYPLWHKHPAGAAVSKP